MDPAGVVDPGLVPPWVNTSPPAARESAAANLDPSTGARYIAQLKLQGFAQNSKNRLGILGLRIIDTQLGDVRVYLQIWDSRDGSIAWEAMEELRIAMDTTREQPIMLRTLLERSAQDLIAKLP